jgi:hypothetical protein
LIATNYVYENSPSRQTAALDADANGYRQWKRTTLDGFGRPIKVETEFDTPAWPTSML